jgi:hypothetical protein
MKERYEPHFLPTNPVAGNPVATNPVATNPVATNHGGYLGLRGASAAARIRVGIGFFGLRDASAAARADHGSA